MNCGDDTATEIDHEVMELLRVSYEKAKELLAGNREALDKIAAFLIEKETITGKEFMEIFRRVNGIEEPEGKNHELTGPVSENEESDTASKEQPAVQEERIITEDPATKTES